MEAAFQHRPGHGGNRELDAGLELMRDALRERFMVETCHGRRMLKLDTQNPLALLKFHIRAEPTEPVS